MEICFDELLPGWPFVPTALCLTNYSQINCLGVFQHAASPLDEEQVIMTQSCQIYSVTKNFQAGGCGVNLYCSCKDLARLMLMKGIPGKGFRGSSRWGQACWRVIGCFGQFCPQVCTGAVSACVMGSSPLHSLTVAVCHGIGCRQETPAVHAETGEGAAARHEGASLLQ